ncbi:MAG: bifunctional 3-(3-hydroxy-phenyl)propionate/3-hydroxycinnamic acid hydroxylase [Rhizobiaceae bacterium]
MTQRYDVAIVGYGPVGATLAALLGRVGVSVIIFDKETGIYNLPRAVHFDDEVMRIFQSAGISDQLVRKVRINPGMRFVDWSGALLLDWPRPSEISPQGWNASYRFHQPDLEAILRNAVASLKTVEVRTGQEIVDATNCRNHVKLTAKNRSTGEPQSVECTYMVGCDGARSSTRSFMNSKMNDFGFRERWLVVDVLLTRPRPDLGDFSIQYCDPDRSATYVRGPENRRRWEIALRQHDSAENFGDPTSIWDRLSDWITPSDAELERSAIYEFRSVVADKWVCERMILAGDSAHQTPPFMGQGMCAGIRDVSNLAWKLLACLNGADSSKLLASYQSERIPHVRQYIEMAVRLGRLINATNSQEALAAAFPLADGSAQIKSIAPPLGPGLWQDNNQHATHLSQQSQLNDGTWMDDRLGMAAGLLVGPDLQDDADCAFDTFRGQTLSATDHPNVAIYLQQLGVACALVRPDRYIFGTANTRAQANRLIRDWDACIATPPLL